MITKVTMLLVLCAANVQASGYPLRQWMVDGQPILGTYQQQSQYELIIQLQSGEMQRLDKTAISYQDRRYTQVVTNQAQLQAEGRAKRAGKRALIRAALDNNRYQRWGYRRPSSAYNTYGEPDLTDLLRGY